MATQESFTAARRRIIISGLEKPESGICQLNKAWLFRIKIITIGAAAVLVVWQPLKSGRLLDRVASSNGRIAVKDLREGDPRPLSVSAERAVNANIQKVLNTPRRLLICGGDVPLTKDNPLVTKMVELAGGKNGRMAIIPTAGSESVADVAGWMDMGIGQAFTFHATSRSEANSSSFYSQLDNATAVWIEGGQQKKLEDIYVGTATEDALHRLLERGGAIGGTSAGAAIQTKLMRRNSSDGRPIEGTGFDFLYGSYVDQHFWQRDRQSLATQMLANNPGHLAFGIDENTGLLVEGRNLTAIADPSQSGHRAVNIYVSAETDPLKPDYVMNNGDRLDLVALLNELQAR